MNISSSAAEAASQGRRMSRQLRRGALVAATSHGSTEFFCMQDSPAIQNSRQPAWLGLHLSALAIPYLHAPCMPACMWHCTCASSATA